MCVGGGGREGGVVISNDWCIMSTKCARGVSSHLFLNKGSWQDFQVTEIDECGKWMQLTSNDIPPPTKDDSKNKSIHVLRTQDCVSGGRQEKGRHKLVKIPEVWQVSSTKSIKSMRKSLCLYKTLTIRQCVQYYNQLYQLKVDMGMLINTVKIYCTDVSSVNPSISAINLHNV